MTPIASTIAGFAPALAGHVTDVASAASVSPALLWGTITLWVLVAGLLAILAGTIARVRETSAAESSHTAPVRPTLGVPCPVCAH